MSQFDPFTKQFCVMLQKNVKIPGCFAPIILLLRLEKNPKFGKALCIKLFIIAKLRVIIVTTIVK